MHLCSIKLMSSAKYTHVYVCRTGTHANLSTYIYVCVCKAVVSQITML